MPPLHLAVTVWICLIKRRRKIYLRWLVLGMPPAWFVWVLNLLAHNALSRHSTFRKLFLLQKLYTSVPRYGNFKLGQSPDIVKRISVRLKSYAKKIIKRNYVKILFKELYWLFNACKVNASIWSLSCSWVDPANCKLTPDCISSRTANSFTNFFNLPAFSFWSLILSKCFKQISHCFR